MGSGSFYLASASDAFQIDGDIFTVPSVLTYFGYYSGKVNSTGFKISSVNIPRGSTVTGGTLFVRCGHSYGNSSTVYRVYAVNEDNAELPSSLSEFNSLSLTSSYVSASQTIQTNGTIYNLANISSIVNEVVSRSGWSSGNGIVFVVKGEYTASTSLCAINIGVETPYLYNVSWTEPAVSTGDTHIPPLSISVGNTGSIGSSTCSTLLVESYSGSYGEMSFSPMSSNQTSGYCDIAPLTMSANGSEIVTTYAQGSMSFDIDNDGLGGMSVGGFTAGLASQFIPILTVSGTAKPGNDGVMSFASTSATGRTGANGGFFLSVPTSTGTTINFARGVCAFQALTLYGFVYTGTLAHGFCSFKKLSCSSLGLNGRIGRGSMGVKIRMLGTGLAGKLMSGESTMQPATATGQASIVSKGTSALAFFPMDMAGVATADASQFSSSKVYDEEAMQ